VLDQEADGTGELVGLLGDHLDGEFLAGQVSAGEFETLCGIALVDVDNCRLGLVATRLNSSRESSDGSSDSLRRGAS